MRNETGHITRQEEREWVYWPYNRRLTERVASLEQLEQTTKQLVEPYLRLAPDVEYVPAIRRAAAEAEAVAWRTPAPLLFLPTLLEEKVHEAIEKVRRQQQIRERSRRILSFLE